MTGWKRWFYYNLGWEYPNDPTEETKRNRHEVLVQIRSYGTHIKDIVLKEEGEIPQKIKAIRTPTTARAVVEADYFRPSTPTIDVGILDNCNDFLDGTECTECTECDAPKTIQEYTSLFEGFDIPPKTKRKRKRNKLNF